MNYLLKKILCLLIFLFIYLIALDNTIIVNASVASDELYNELQCKVKHKNDYYLSNYNYNNNENNFVEYTLPSFLEENFHSETNLLNSTVCLISPLKLEKFQNNGILSFLNNAIKVLIVILFCIVNYKIIRYKIK